VSVYELDLSGLRVTSARLTTPLAGAWTADVGLPDDTALPPGPLTLSIGNLAVTGAVVRTDSLGGSRHVRLVGGAGGWARETTPQGYHDDGGVIRGTVLRDLAALTGEVFFPADLAAASDSVGTDYVREAAPASRTLEQLVGEQWWIDPQGQTHLVPRPTGTLISSPFLIERYDGGAGRIVASTEDYASWVPGAVLVSELLDQPMTLVDVAIVTDGDESVRVEAMVVPQGAPLGGLEDRVLGALRAIIRQEARALTFAGVWEYQVTSSTVDAAGRTLVDGLPLAPGATLPPLRSAEVRPGVPGLSCAPAVGSRVLVAFVNQSPARPVIVSFDSAPPTSAAVTSPAITLGAGAGVPVALAPALTAWSATLVSALAAATPPITIPPLDPSVSAIQVKGS
jgi:hypothetical protein